MKDQGGVHIQKMRVRQMRDANTACMRSQFPPYIFQQKKLGDRTVRLAALPAIEEHPAGKRKYATGSGDPVPVAVVVPPDDSLLAGFAAAASAVAFVARASAVALAAPAFVPALPAGG